METYKIKVRCDMDRRVLVESGDFKVSATVFFEYETEKLDRYTVLAGHFKTNYFDLVHGLDKNNAKITVDNMPLQALAPKIVSWLGKHTGYIVGKQQEYTFELDTKMNLPKIYDAFNPDTPLKEWIYFKVYQRDSWQEENDEFSFRTIEEVYNFISERAKIKGGKYVHLENHTPTYRCDSIQIHLTDSWRYFLYDIQAEYFHE